MKEMDIQNVSDTALWIAGYRALESERADAAFKDHLASKLAGNKGLEIVRQTPNTKAMAFAMVLRTVAIDRLIQNAIEYGADTIINLGAGLDSRPFRMNLPANLKWIEVDLPQIMNYKKAIIEQEKPVCKLELITCDLSNETARQLLFRQLGSYSHNTLIITEGLIGYLTNEQALNLATDLFNTAGFKYWIMDYSQGRFRRNKQSNKVAQKLKHSAALLFDHADPLTYLSQPGWVIRDNLFILDEADRIGRKLPLLFPWTLVGLLFPRLLKRLGNKTYGFVLFSK